MKFEIVHVFKNVDLATYEKMFFDENFNTAMMPTAGLKKREPLERREENGVLHKKTRIVPDRDFPPPLNKFIKDELAYVETTTFDPKTHRQVWKSDVNVLPGKLDMAGDVTFRDVPGGVERKVTGEVKVSVFGVGGIIEKMVVDNLKETYDKVAVFSQKWIDEGKASLT